MNKISVVSFYELDDIPEFLKISRDIERIAHKEKILGTFIICPQGINTTLAGSKEALNKVISLIEEVYCLKISTLNWSESTKIPFKRFKLKVKDALLPLRGNFDLLKQRGKIIEPKEWNDLLKNEDALVLDLRNKYETDIGTFKHSTLLNIDSFNDFPDVVEKRMKNLKSNKIAMFCTGGIRCEIASSFLVNQGFHDVNQLKGGILNYLEVVGVEGQLWKGECFVFDERVSLDQSLDEGNFEQCFGCRRPLSKEDLQSKKYIKGVACSYCYAVSSESDKNRFAQRQKQIELAEKRGYRHMGFSARQTQNK